MSKRTNRVKLTMAFQDFKAGWNEAESQLSPISRDRLSRFPISPKTANFLTIAGLPKYGPGYLSFAEDSGDKVYGVVKLTEQYEFFGEEAKYDKYIVIGSCRDGGAIAIDERALTERGFWKEQLGIIPALRQEFL